MKLVVDNQLPPKLAVYLRWRGHEAAHVNDLGLGAASDLDVWAHCVRERAVLVTKDEDFIFLANRPNDSGRLIWVRLGNCRNAALVEVFDRLLDDAVEALSGGQRVIEIRA